MTKIKIYKDQFTTLNLINEEEVVKKSSIHDDQDRPKTLVRMLKLYLPN